MATVTVSASTTLAALSYAAGDDIVITGATTLTVDANPSALPAIRSIRSTDPRSKLYIRNSATAYSAGNLWRVPFENAGSIVGTGGTLAFTGGATCEIEGEWLTCYTATGTANETVLDASNVVGVDVDFPYFIQAETAVGSGVYKPVPVVVVGGAGDGYLAVSLQTRFGVGDVGLVLFYDRSTRLLKTGDGTNGALFASGVRFRIPNILMWLPPFTLTVGAGGWTAATGSQPVSSSTNAPVNTSTTLPAYAIGSESININSLPSGTAVNVATRAIDGSTATTYTAGTIAYAVPNTGLNMAGKILSATGGIYLMKKCFFSRWWAPSFNAFSNVASDQVGFVAPYNGIGISNTSGSFSHTNGVIVCSPALIRQRAFDSTAVAGDVSLSGTSLLGTVSTIGTAGYGNTSFANITTTLSISGMQDVRMWRMGCPAGVVFASSGLGINASSFKSDGINGLELVNLNLNITDVTMRSCRRLRYSSTSGITNTSTTDTPFAFGASAKSVGIVISDFDIISGGHAPYGSWFTINTNAESLLIHNKVGGSTRTIDCQGRTQTPVGAFNGANHLFANAIFSNMRTGGTAFSSSAGSSNTIRNVRWSDLAGAVVDSSSIQAVRGAKFDFPGGPLNALNGTSSGLLSNQPDVQAVYACPNTWPGLAGGLYVGPISAKQQVDLYDLTGGAYQNNNGVLFIETTGDTAVIKATQPVTGISSVTGTAPVFYGVNPSTGLTYEFRLCNWGEDITALGWTAMTGANVQSAFNALTGYSVYTGINFQMKITATTTSAGRLLQQCWIPVQMDTAYNPPVSTVPLGVVGATSGSLAAFYYGPSDTLIGTATVSGGGTASVAAPYDFDGSTVAYKIRVRGLSSSSETVSATYGINGASVPVPQQALTGYVAGPYAGASFNKSTKTVTVTTGMTTQQLWSAWREYITQLANYDVADTWSYPTLNAPDWTITTSGGGSISGPYADVNGAYVSASISNIVNGSRILIQRTDTNAVLANAIVSGTTYGYTVQTATAIPIKVVLRKASSAPFYQEWSATGNIDPVGGFAAVAAQQPD